MEPSLSSDRQPLQISTGTAFADIDGDAKLDLLVNSLGGGTRSFLNDDGWDDLVVGGSRLAVFQNDGKGKFIELTNRLLVSEKSGEFGCILAYSQGAGAKITLSDIPNGARNVEVMSDGNLKVVGQ